MVDDVGQFRLPERRQARHIDVQIVQGAEQPAGERVAGADCVDKGDNRGGPLYRARVLGVGRRALRALRDDNQGGAELEPIGGDGRRPLVRVQPAQILVAGLDDMRSGDTAFDQRLASLWCAEQPGPHIRVVAQNDVARCPDPTHQPGNELAAGRGPRRERSGVQDGRLLGQAGQLLGRPLPVGRGVEVEVVGRSPLVVERHDGQRRWLDR